jgi:hypothetical protein
MKEAREKISQFLKEILNLKYNYNMENLKNILNNIGFVENTTLKVTKKKLDKWKKERIMNNKLEDFSYIINPCKNMSLFIRLLNGLYFSFVFIQGESESPIFRTNIELDYIYVYTNKFFRPTIYFYGRDIITNEEANLLDVYYRKQKNYLTNLNINYNKINTNNDFKLGFSADLNINVIVNLKNEFFDKDRMIKKMINVAKKIASLFIIWQRKIDALDSSKF